MDPAKPYGQLVDEVMAFLDSDVGWGGILTNDNIPNGDPVPPYFYHFAIYDENRLWSAVTTYPGYTAISYPGYTASVAIDAFLDYHRYNGDTAFLERACAFADWIIEHRTPAGDLYGNLPYSSQTGAVMGGGWDGDAIMTDKPAMFGLRLLRLFDVTGDSLYWTAAQGIAATLAATQLAGEVADDGRWPFRVRPADGVVRQDYTSHLQPAVRFFDSMAERLGDPTYADTRDRAWQWLLANPANPASDFYHRWEAFYEDQDSLEQTGEVDHYSANEMIVELIHRQPPGWRESAVDILTWTADQFLVDETGQGLAEYIPATLEWEGWPQATYAATLQFARTALLLYQALEGDPLQDPLWEQWAFGMTAVCSHGQNQRDIAADGRMYTTIKDIIYEFKNRSWYEQNFNTAKYYLELMALDPDLAPGDEYHMLSATSAVRSVVYPPLNTTVRYEVAGGAGRERLKLADTPREVVAGGASLPLLPDPDDPGPGWHWDPVTYVLTVEHEVDPVELLFGLSAVADGDGLTRIGADETASLLRLTVAGPGSGRSGSSADDGHPVVLSLILAEAMSVTVNVFDLRGRRVRILFAGDALPAGETALIWNGDSEFGGQAASGVYLVRAESRAASASLTVTLIR
ncbi:MAG: hypothetical protein ABIF77_20800 [bacterium]